MEIFILFGLIYYIPAYLFYRSAKNQSGKKSLYKEENSKTERLQSFLLSLIYIFLLGEIGFSLCTTLVTANNGLIDEGLAFFAIVILLPNLVQYFSSMMFLPKYWNPRLYGLDRYLLLAAFFFGNVYYAIKITLIFLNSSSLAGGFFIFGSLFAFPSYFLVLYLAAKESKPDAETYSRKSNFTFGRSFRRLLYLCLFYIVISLAQKELVYQGRISLGMSPEQAKSITADDLLTEEKYILGEDKNKNYIRDDYEYWVEKNYSDYDKKMSLLQYGRSHFKYMASTISGLKKIKGKVPLSNMNLLEKDSKTIEYYVRQHLFWSGACVKHVFKDEGDEISKKAEALLVNNKDRYDVEKMSHFSGGGFNIPDYEGCHFRLKEDDRSEITFKNLRNSLLHSIEAGEIDKVKELCRQIVPSDIEDYMVAEISTAALLKQNLNQLDILFDCGIDFRKKFKDSMYGSSEEPFEIAKGLQATNSVKWFEAKYRQR